MSNSKWTLGSWRIKPIAQVTHFSSLYTCTPSDRIFRTSIIQMTHIYRGGCNSQQRWIFSWRSLSSIFRVLRQINSLPPLVSPGEVCLLLLSESLPMMGPLTFWLDWKVAKPTVRRPTKRGVSLTCWRLRWEFRCLYLRAWASICLTQ